LIILYQSKSGGINRVKTGFLARIISC